LPSIKRTNNRRKEEPSLRFGIQRQTNDLIWQGSFMRKLTAREVIARSYPTWDLAMADRLIAWLDRNGYQIVQKPHAAATLVPAETDQSEPAAQLDRAH
jgi:hypothetical protein